MVDIIFLAHHRREFTEASLKALYQNTNWDLPMNCTIYLDDCPDDCTLTPKQMARYGIVVKTGKWGSPVAIMRDALTIDSPRRGASDEIYNKRFLVKIDNDTIVPPGWLDTCLATMEQFPRVDLLGIEAYGELATSSEHSPASRHIIYACPVDMIPPLDRGVQLTDHIGGIGVFRYRAFKTLPEPRGTHYGFTEWQWEHPEIVKAWLAPALPVFLLDHLPFSPWRELGAEYEAKGWQRRQWPEYGPECSGLWDWWKP